MWLTGIFEFLVLNFSAGEKHTRVDQKRVAHIRAHIFCQGRWHSYWYWLVQSSHSRRLGSRVQEKREHLFNLTQVVFGISSVEKAEALGFQLNKSGPPRLKSVMSNPNYTSRVPSQQRLD